MLYRYFRSITYEAQTLHVGLRSKNPSTIPFAQDIWQDICVKQNLGIEETEKLHCYNCLKDNLQSHRYLTMLLICQDIWQSSRTIFLYMFWNRSQNLTNILETFGLDEWSNFISILKSVWSMSRPLKYIENQNLKTVSCSDIWTSYVLLYSASRSRARSPNF